MADTVTVTQIHDSSRYCEYEFTNESDGTGESSVLKIDIDNLVGLSGALAGGDRPTSLALLNADWEVNGFNYVTLSWDRAASDALCQVMASNGAVSYYSTGGKQDPNRDLDGTGNILLTIDGPTDGDSYRIRVMFRKKYG